MWSRQPVTWLGTRHVPPVATQPGGEMRETYRNQGELGRSSYSQSASTDCCSPDLGSYQSCQAHNQSSNSPVAGSCPQALQHMKATSARLTLQRSDQSGTSGCVISSMTTLSICRHPPARPRWRTQWSAVSAFSPKYLTAACDLALIETLFGSYVTP